METKYKKKFIDTKPLTLKKIYTIKCVYKEHSKNLKMCPVWIVALYELLPFFTGLNYMHYTLFIIGKNVAALYRQWLVI